MRTSIVIDDKLMKDVLRATGVKTKREAVALGRKTLIRLGEQDAARDVDAFVLHLGLKVANWEY